MQKVFGSIVCAVFVLFMGACGHDDVLTAPSSIDQDTVKAAPKATPSPTPTSQTKATTSASPTPTPIPATSGTDCIAWHVESGANPFSTGTVGQCLASGPQTARIVIDDAGKSGFTVQYNAYHCDAKTTSLGVQCAADSKNFCDGRSADFMDEGPGISVNKMQWGPHEKGTLIIPIDSNYHDCGRVQYDTAFIGGTSCTPLGNNGGVFFAGIESYGHNCNTCGLVDSKLSVTQQADHVITFSVTFRGGDSATLDFGDGTVTGLSHYSNPSQTHTYVNHGTYQVRLHVVQDGVPCDASATVTITPTCADVNVQGSALVNGTSATVSASWTGSGAGTIALDGGSAVTIANNGSKTYSGLAEGGHSAVITVANGNGSCPKTVPFTIAHVPVCSDYTAPTITGDITSDVRPTQVIFSQGTVAPIGGTFSNAALPATIARPNYGQPAGSFSTTYKLPYGPVNLQCSVSKLFTKPVPPQEQSQCRLTLDKQVDMTSVVPGDWLKYTLVVANEGNADCTGVTVDDDPPSNVQYQSSSGTVGQCTWVGNNSAHWNCGTMHPNTSISVSWKGKVTNPSGNYSDFTIKNLASALSFQTGTVPSNGVSTFVDVPEKPLCQLGITPISSPPPAGWLTAICDDYWSINNFGAPPTWWRVTITSDPNVGIVGDSISIPVGMSFRFVSSEPMLFLWLQPVPGSWSAMGSSSASTRECDCRLP